MSKRYYDKIDGILKKYGEMPVFRGNSFGVSYAKRIDNFIYIKSLTHIAEGTIMNEEDNMRIVFRYRMKASIRLFFFIPIVFLLLFLFSPKVTINGELNPSFSYKALFALIGLVLIGIVYSIFQSGRRVIKNEVEREFGM